MFLPELCQLSQFVFADFAEYFKNIYNLFIYFLIRLCKNMESVGRVVIFHFTGLTRSLLCKTLDRNDSYGAC